jgi:ATP-dependent DNA ligase
MIPLYIAKDAGVICEPMADPQTRAHFIEPVLLLRANRLPEGEGWECEVKLDGYRANAFRSGGPRPPPILQRQGL